MITEEDKERKKMMEDFIKKYKDILNSDHYIDALNICDYFPEPDLIRVRHYHYRTYKTSIEYIRFTLNNDLQKEMNEYWLKVHNYNYCNPDMNKLKIHVTLVKRHSETKNDFEWLSWGINEDKRSNK